MVAFKGVVFDMDGTLVDSESIWEIAEAEMFAERQLEYTDAEREQVIGLRLDAFFQKLIEIYGLDERVEDLADELTQRMLEKIPTMVKPKPGASALIKWTAQQGLPYCIASSSPTSIIKAIVDAMGWADIMPLYYSADDVAQGKPAPDVYLYAAQKIDVAPVRCLALEDSINGARAAVAAGMTTYIVPDAHTDKAKYAGISPHIYESLHIILEELQQKN